MANINFQQQIEELEFKLKTLQRDKDALEKNSLENQKDQVKVQENKVKLAEIEVKLAEENLKYAKLHEASLETHFEALDKARAALQEVSKEYQKQKELLSEINELSKSFVSDMNGALGMVNDFNDTGLGKFLSLSNKIGSKWEAFQKITNDMSVNFKSRFLTSILQKGQEGFLLLFKNLDDIGAKLQSSIPQGRKYQAMINDIATSGTTAYLGYEQLGEAVISLSNNFTNFTKIQDEEQKQLVKTSATLERLGVDTETFAQNLDFAVKSIGLTTKEFETFETELYSLSKTTGTSMATLNKDFKQVQGRLSNFEKTKALKIFKDMSVAARKLGIETDKLFDITENFTTFEGASEAAGTLNSVLGGNLINTIDLMNASLDNPIEVFKQFKTAIDKTGKSFADMTPAMKRVLADATKMDTVELGKLMSQDIDDAVIKLEDAAQAQKEMQEAAANATPVIEKLYKILYGFGQLMSPVIDKFHSLINYLNNLNGPVATFIKYVGSGIVVLGGLSLAFKPVIAVIFTLVGGLKSMVGATKLATVGTKMAEPAITRFGSTMSKVGTQLTVGAKGFASLALLVVSFGASIALAALGLSQFVKSFENIDTDKIGSIGLIIGGLVVAIGAFGIAIALLAPKLAIAGTAMLPFSLAIASIGISIALAAYGMSTLVDSFGKFFTVADPGKIFLLSGAITALAGSFGSLSLALIGVGGSSLGLAALGLSLRMAFSDSLIEKLETAAASLTTMVNGAQLLTQQNTGLSNSSFRAQTANSNNSNNQVMVSLPEQTIKLEIKAPIILNGSKVGDFVQEEIVRREGKLVPGSIQNGVGIKVSSYND